MHTSSRNNDPYFPSAAEATLHLFECDIGGCPNKVEEEGDFSAVWSGARRDGWVTRKVGSQWRHYCPKHRGLAPNP